MSIRAEFEKKFPVPPGIEWIDDNQEYRITSDDDYWFDHEGAREAARFVGAWKGWQAAHAQDGQGVGVVKPSDPLPCPFCGSTDVGGAGGTVGCYRCPAEIAVQNANTAYAVELWNNRVKPHPQPAQQGSVPEGFSEFVSAVRSINRSSHHQIRIPGDDEPCFWQRKEWIDWILELADQVEASLSSAAPQPQEGSGDE